MNNKLLFKIEELRRELNKYAHKKNLAEPEVLEISRKLDSLLNQYQKLIYGN